MFSVLRLFEKRDLGDAVHVDELALDLRVLEQVLQLVGKRPLLQEGNRRQRRQLAVQLLCFEQIVALEKHVVRRLQNLLALPDQLCLDDEYRTWGVLLRLWLGVLRV